MMPSASRINISVLIAVILGALVLFYVGWKRTAIDTDIVSSLPHDDPVLDSAMHIFRNHPMQDQITIDVGIDRDDTDLLVACGLDLSARLENSGLFKSVGMTDIQEQLPRLVDQVVNRLPELFTAAMLEKDVAPLLTPESVDAAIGGWQERLLQMDAIGQAAYIARDPLSLKDSLLARLLFLAPSQKARVYKGQLISADGRHLLVTAVPTGSATDTAFARRLSAALEKIDASLGQAFSGRGIQVTLTPVGAFRAALDNEVIIRRDVQNAILFATLGIAVLLLIAFPRPLIGLFSLLPALVGTMTAFFVWSLFHDAISIMVLGFGGAIISITVDHGIAYLLFLDRPEKAYGKQASREIWAIGLLATLTTVGAFAALTVSRFDIFRQLGQFAAMGIAFSFLFVHLIFPRIFPSLPASRPRRLPLPKLADRLFSMGTKGLVAAVLFAAGMAVFARPGFNADVGAMNTVSQESLAAEKHLMSVWGNIFSKVFLLTEADTLADLQRKNDRLLAGLESDPDADLLDQAFLPSMLFPGPERRAANLAAWKAFWTPDRRDNLVRTLNQAGTRYGFADGAFAPFIATLEHPETALPASHDGTIPRSLFALVGISADAGSNVYRQFTSLALPTGYSGERFFARYANTATIFDPALFSRQLGELMVSTFTRLIAIIAPVVVILLLIFFADLKLTLIALAPVAFAMLATLGTLTLMGRRLDIPSLMLAIIILGMGIDYSLFLVRAYQRYGKADHPGFTLIRSAVVMTSASTLVGFGVLALAHHTLLQSAGITSLLGIGYSALGAFLILPPLLRRHVERQPSPLPSSAGIQARVCRRYRSMEPYVRFFARFKMRLDPMFGQLDGVIDFPSTPQTLLDIGSGFGVPACWLAETFPTARVYGIEPDPNRVRVANRALGGDGTVIPGLAPSLPDAPSHADGAFMLDMMHFLSPEDLQLLLQRLHGALGAHGRLIIRNVMTPTRRFPWHWWIDRLKSRLVGPRTFFRSNEAIQAMINQCGFDVQTVRQSDAHGELVWFGCRKAPEGDGDQ
ncbi:MMPL family transporter [Desulfosarcina ovata]|uniref:MMPL family protein n=1 Tax=Desulfosarcina ovata subsp. ovata TaxID=2752305 RepID=A0A5K8AA16_9BACT|nr:MMPL family transporter [Desulfosarcina ovata]BBO88860.1 hypothetical protein DSCOOX_20400 [Desulfosarcina ovata subsp. ovata]